MSRARLNCAAAHVELAENRPVEAVRHGRQAVEILEGLLTGRERVWIESELLRSFWLVRGQAHAENGELLEASRFLGLALSDAEAALAAEPRDLAARRVAVDAALAFAQLETEGPSVLEWAQRAEGLLAAAVCDDLALRSLAGRRQAVEALTESR